jgi:hypothetical protein
VEGGLPPRDPRAAHRRKVIAARRVGLGKKCTCGESRPEALIAGEDPAICARCDRKRRRWETSDYHHIFGIANSPVKISTPVTDHRASLSVSQQDWPRETLENRDGSPLLAAAAKIRGFGDFVLYLIQEHLLPGAEILEYLDAFLKRKLGKKYWKKMKLKAFEPPSQ